MRIRNINKKPRRTFISMDPGIRYISSCLNFISKIVNKMKDILYTILLIILYERGRVRLSLILQYMVLLSFEIIRPVLGSKSKNKIDYYSQLFKINISRSPAFVSDHFDKTLRVCITYRCNASCEFCYGRGLLKEFPMDMNLDDFVFLARWAKKEKWKNMLFLGGEPIVHPQFEKILDICDSEKINVYLSTNGFFNNDKLLKKFKSSSVRHIAFSYPQDRVPHSFRKQFLHNLEYLKKEKEIFLILSGILDGKADIWKEIVETAIRFRLPIRWTLLLPGYTRDISNYTVLSNLNLIGLQLFEVLKTCADRNIICYVYRPVPACMFTPEQWQKIRKIYRYLVYTRCPLGFKNKYSAGVTVNPDLSTYACISFFIKGPHIASFKDRTSLSQYYENVAKEIMKTPPMKECNNCQLYKNFLSSIAVNKNRSVKGQLCDKNICQAGCFSFREITCSTL